MKNTKTVLNLALAIVLMTSLNAAAQGGPGGGRGGQGGQPPTPAIDTALDANGDEVISGDEIANAESALMALDADGDGGLSFEESMGLSSGGNSQQAPPSGRGGSGGQPPAPPTFSALDANGNQIVDNSEIANASQSLLRLDENGDGSLSPEEYRPQRGGGQMGGGPGGGGQGRR